LTHDEMMALVEKEAAGLVAQHGISLPTAVACVLTGATIGLKFCIGGGHPLQNGAPTPPTEQPNEEADKRFGQPHHGHDSDG
jgi:hypothetical protein